MFVDVPIVMTIAPAITANFAEVRLFGFSVAQACVLPVTYGLPLTNVDPLPCHFGPELADSDAPTRSVDDITGYFKTGTWCAAVVVSAVGALHGVTSAAR